MCIRDRDNSIKFEKKREKKTSLEVLLYQQNKFLAISFCIFTILCVNLCFNFNLLSIIFRDYFYQFGEIRSINIASAKSCAFVCYTTRMAAEFAADRSFNKAIVNGKRLKVSWGRSQEERSGGKDDKDKNSKQYAPVPGLPGGKFFIETF